MYRNVKINIVIYTKFNFFM